MMGLMADYIRIWRKDVAKMRELHMNTNSAPSSSPSLRLPIDGRHIVNIKINWQAESASKTFWLTKQKVLALKMMVLFYILV